MKSPRAGKSSLSRQPLRVSSVIFGVHNAIPTIQLDGIQRRKAWGILLRNMSQRNRSGRARGGRAKNDPRLP